MDGIIYRKPGEMKDSGINWLGEIPKSWDITQLGYNAKMIVPMRDKPTSFNGDIPWIRIEDFDGKYIEKSKSDQNVTKSLIKKMNLKIYPPGTVLCTCSCNLGTTAIVNRELVSNQTFIGIVPQNNIYSDFLYYLMNSNAERLQWMSIGAIQQYLSRDNYEKLKIQLPSLNEQYRIANFLDTKTAQFEFIIAKKELLIQKLEEAKKSLISEVVTGKVKIVDGEMVPRQPEEMKDSGIEWLGTIPKDWEVKRLKYLMQINPVKSEITNKNQVCSFVPMNKIHNAIIDIDEIKTIKEVYEGYTYFKDGDIIMAKVTPCFENGDIAIASDLINGMAFGTTEIHVFRVYFDYDTSFIFYLLQENHFKRYGSSHMTGVAGLKRVPTSYISNFIIAIPDLNEQKYLLNFIENIIHKINNIEIRIQLQLQKLKQAKQSLISEAVTGKIDLRNWEIIEEGGVQ